MLTFTIPDIHRYPHLTIPSVTSSPVLNGELGMTWWRGSSTTLRWTQRPCAVLGRFSVPRQQWRRCSGSNTHHPRSTKPCFFCRDFPHLGIIERWCLIWTGDGIMFPYHRVYINFRRIPRLEPPWQVDRRLPVLLLPSWDLVIKHDQAAFPQKIGNAMPKISKNPLGKIIIWCPIVWMPINWRL